MANDRIIRKKFNRTVCDCLVVDLETGQSSTIAVTINGRHRFNEKKLKKEVEKMLPIEIKCIKITGIEITSENRVMSEDFFLANSSKAKGE